MKNTWEHFPDQGPNYYAMFDENGHFQKDTQLGLIEIEKYIELVNALEYLWNIISNKPNEVYLDVHHILQNASKIRDEVEDNIP